MLYNNNKFILYINYYILYNIINYYYYYILLLLIIIIIITINIKYYKFIFVIGIQLCKILIHNSIILDH